jgi:radical SAM superfamily enzyme YgiQ (UPF0313 family)
MKEGIEVSALDQAAKDLSVKNSVDWVKKEDPDILGFTTLTHSSRTAAIIAKEVKRANPNIKIVFGGYHATFNSKRILKKYSHVDVVVRGEGEYTCLDLVKSLESRNKLKEVRGIAFRKGKKIILTQDRPVVKNIDSLPFPDRRLLDSEYHSMTAGVIVAPKKFSSFITSRGCVFRCRFCGCQSFAHKLWRPRSVENLLEELHFLVSEGYKQLLFVDDNFTLNPRRAIKLCRRIKKEKVDIEWICEGRVDNCSYDMMREISKTGCRMIYFGVESANQRILDYYNKQITPKQSKAAVKAARKGGIDAIVGSFIVGAPNESRKEIQNTLSFAQKTDIDIPQFNILGAFPGTDIWNELKVKGVLQEDRYWETGVSVPEISTNTVPHEEIKQLIDKHYKLFFLRPKFMLKEVLMTLSSLYRIDLIINNLNRVRNIIQNVKCTLKQS